MIVVTMSWPDPVIITVVRNCAIALYDSHAPTIVLLSHLAEVFSTEDVCYVRLLRRRLSGVGRGPAFTANSAESVTRWVRRENAVVGLTGVLL